MKSNCPFLESSSDFFLFFCTKEAAQQRISCCVGKMKAKAIRLCKALQSSPQVPLCAAVGGKGDVHDQEITVMLHQRQIKTTPGSHKQF